MITHSSGSESAECSRTASRCTSRPAREEGVDLVRDIGDFDVAIVDMRWRQNGIVASISGDETIRILRRSSPALGIVAHGERPERHIASAAMQAGASAYVARTTAAERAAQGGRRRRRPGELRRPRGAARKAAAAS